MKVGFSIRFKYFISFDRILSKSEIRVFPSAVSVARCSFHSCDGDGSRLLKRNISVNLLQQLFPLQLSKSNKFHA